MRCINSALLPFTNNRQANNLFVVMLQAYTLVAIIIMLQLSATGYGHCVHHKGLIFKAVSASQ